MPSWFWAGGLPPEKSKFMLVRLSHRRTLNAGLTGQGLTHFDLAMQRSSNEVVGLGLIETQRGSLLILLGAVAVAAGCAVGVVKGINEVVKLVENFEKISSWVKGKVSERPPPTPAQQEIIAGLLAFMAGGATSVTVQAVGADGQLATYRHSQRDLEALLAIVDRANAAKPADETDNFDKLIEKLLRRNAAIEPLAPPQISRVVDDRFKFKAPIKIERHIETKE